MYLFFGIWFTNIEIFHIPNEKTIFRQRSEYNYIYSIYLYNIKRKYFKKGLHKLWTLYIFYVSYIYDSLQLVKCKVVIFLLFGNY